MKDKKTKRSRPSRFKQAPKKCYFCTEKKEVSLWETPVLSRFLTERGKIIGRSRNGFCAKHQKELTTSVKRARYLALLPFVARG